MPTTFLHLSDLHYRPNWDEEIELVFNRFADDLQQQIKSYENVYLVFSGDLVFAGSDSDSYSAFSSRMIEVLNKVGIPRERRICVPGNHDLSQDALKPVVQVQLGALSAMKSELQFNDNLATLSSAFFNNTFGNYLSAEQHLAHYTCCQESLGGTGWELSNDVGLYCLNTSLCSSGGLTPDNDSSFVDRNRLMVDTRSMHRWLASAATSKRILVMHHPVDWLTEWAKSELAKVIAHEFDLVFCGHVHDAAAIFVSRGGPRSVQVIAPPLFTRKSQTLGYAFVTLHDNGKVDVTYRQWTPAQKFVTGSALASNDSGSITFSRDLLDHEPALACLSAQVIAGDTQSVLQAEFDDSIVSYSARHHAWVDRDLATLPENAPGLDKAVVITQHELIKNLRSCVVKAPKQFGLTCLGRFIALRHYIDIHDGKVVVMLNMAEMQAHRQGVIHDVTSRCAALGISTKAIGAFIVDNCHADKKTQRIVSELQSSFGAIPLILLQNIDDLRLLGQTVAIGDTEGFDTLFLWALTRQRVHELVDAYVEGMDQLDDDLVTKRIIEDLDALNIHRTPSNCLLMLKLVESAFEDSPVNRTEMIHRVLTILFFQFDRIPTYATRPDLKDCEYALGYFCEWLVHIERQSFTREDFHKKINEYCTAQLIDLDVEVLFAFLVDTNILVRKGYAFEFRFTYWLHFFAAHRMHHNRAFAEFILENRRYSAFPELIEFYAGIDRRRSDAVERVTKDLSEMNADFIQRAGISEGFNPYAHAQWSPDERTLDVVQQEVANGMADSSLPDSVKDAAADAGYDRARPYNQDLARFIETSTLLQLITAVRGAARVLRNSDHVPPEAKTALLEQVISSWAKISQLLVILSPVLATQREAAFEDISFVLAKGFNQVDARERWNAIMTAIPDNVVGWFQEDLFSRRMGTLLANYAHQQEDTLEEFLAMMVMIKQRPPGWEKEAARFIGRVSKNSFYLGQLFMILWRDFRLSFSTERTRLEMQRLAGMALAKHETGAKHPNTKLIGKAVAALEKEK